MHPDNKGGENPTISTILVASPEEMLWESQAEVV
jgi:hypothetical protein